MPSSTSRHASHERRRLAALWTGTLAGPLVWLVLLETNYVLASVACETRRTWFLYVCSLAALAIVIAAGMWGWRAQIDDPVQPDHATPPLGEETALQRVRWMALAAAIFSAGFALLIASMQIPVIVHGVCD